MQPPERPVKPERTGWRDLSLNDRHRQWGWNCPALDLDFLFLEYDKGKAVALVEYKHERAQPQYASHPTYQAMIDLADRAGVPCFAVRYAADFSWWRIIPLNDHATLYVPKRVQVNEREWITLLYRLRGYDPPESLFRSEGVQI